MKKFKILFLSIIGLMFITSCSKSDDETPNPNEQNLVTQIIKPTGGEITTNDGIKIIFPNGSVPIDTEVSIGYTGNEPTTFVNTKFQLLTKAFTVKIAIDSLNQNAIIEIPKPNNFTNSSETKILINNGSNYFPLFWQESGNKLIAQLDYLNFEDKYQAQNKTSNGIISTLIVYVIKDLQNPPSNQLGLKKVDFDANNNLIFSDVNNITSNDKVLIMVHGWNSYPSSPWTDFLIKLKPQISASGYTRYLTFGYNSSLGINENGQILSSLLQSKMNGATVDIIGHSMGGLVSRSAIENHNCSNIVRNLITLGTPHKGSNSAVLRYLLGFMLGSSFDGDNYDINTQGFRDLNTFSTFLTTLNSNPAPSTNYYPISAIKGSYNIHQTDGVVKKSSALGVQNNDNQAIGGIFQITGLMPHLVMTNDDYIINHVATKLNSFNPVGISDNQGYIYGTTMLNNREWTNENWRIGDKLWVNNVQYGSYTIFGSSLSNLPNNWRLPTKAEFESLINSLGSTAFSVLTSTTGFNAKPYGNVYEQNTTNPTETNGEFNNKAIFLSSTLDVYTGGNGPIYYTNCLVIDFVTQTVSVQSLLSSVVGNVNFQKNYYNVRLLKN